MNFCRSLSSSPLGAIPLVMGLMVALPDEGAAIESDDFSGGNDNAWTRVAPLSMYGVANVFSFPDGAYRLQAGQSPAPLALGPARISSLRMQSAYTDFYVSVDIVALDLSLDQSVGLASRIQEPGLGTTDGYLLFLRPQKSDLLLQRVDNENTVALASGSIAYVPGHTYRLAFSGVGTHLSGQIFDLADLSTPMITLDTFSSAYGSGVNGVLAASNVATGLGTADATFDNFFANVPELGAAALLLTGILALGPLRKRA